MVVFIPFSANGENQRPHSHQWAARLGLCIHRGLGLGEVAMGLGWGT